MSKRVIGKKALLLTAIGGIIGSGWLFGPYYAAQNAGPAALISWIIGGAMMMVIALTFAELSAMLPLVGGVARFSHFSHGTFVSFTMSWCGWISSIAVAPIETMALLQYASNYLPQLAERVGPTHDLTPLGIGIAALLMLLMCHLNSFGIKLVTNTNNSIVVLKILIPVATALFFMGTHFDLGNLTTPSFAPYGLHGILTALPAAGVIFSFIGYTPAIMLAGETKNPQKNIPFAIIGSLLFCGALYLLLQLAFLGAVDSLLLENGWQSLHFEGDTGPFAGMAMHLGLMWLATLLFIDAAISPFGTALVYTSASARMNYAMSQNGYMPAFMQKLNANQSPTASIWTNYAFGLILFLPFPGWQSLVSFLISAFILSYAVGPISCSSLRKIMPNAKRPFRLPFETGFAIVAFYFCNLLAFWTGWQTFSKLLIAIGVGYLFLAICKMTKEGKKLDLNFRSGLWLFPYYSGLGLFSYLGTFGEGLGLLSFGWDFLIIFIFSLGIYQLAQISRMKPTRPYEVKTDELPVI